MKRYNYKGVEIHYTTTKVNAQAFLATYFTADGVTYDKSFNVESIHEVEPGFYIYKKEDYYRVPTEDGIMFESKKYNTAAEYLTVFVSDTSPFLIVNNILIIAYDFDSFDKAKDFLSYNPALNTDRVYVFMNEILYLDKSLGRYVWPRHPECDNIVDWYDMAEFIYSNKKSVDDL